MKLYPCLSKAVAAVCLAALLCSCGAAMPGGSGSSGGSSPSWPTKCNLVEPGGI